MFSKNGSKRAPPFLSKQPILTIVNYPTILSFRIVWVFAPHIAEVTALVEVRCATFPARWDFRDLPVRSALWCNWPAICWDVADAANLFSLSNRRKWMKYVSTRWIAAWLLSLRQFLVWPRLCRRIRVDRRDKLCILSSVFPTSTLHSSTRLESDFDATFRRLAKKFNTCSRLGYIHNRSWILRLLVRKKWNKPYEQFIVAPFARYSRSTDLTSFL